MRARWSKADSYLLEGMLALALALTAVIGVLIPLLGVAGVTDPVDRVVVGISTDATGTAERTADGDTDGAAGPDGVTLRPGVILEAPDEGTLLFTEPDAGQRALLALPSIVGGVLAVVAIVLLLRVARTLRHGDPFIPQNARRILFIGFLIAIGGVLEPAVRLIQSGTLIDSAAVQGEAVPVGIGSLTAIMVGFGLVALSEVFRRGTRLRADTEGLV